MATAPILTNEKIPNNVHLSDDRRLQRALERWQPDYLDWWKTMGPEGWQEQQVYLRTAISVDTDGWAHFDHVKMPDYRWGIFLTPSEDDRKIGFGDYKGQPVWNEVPGEHRNALRRLIVTQADTEPASVEQQRNLGDSCPSLYDLRNLFQVNVEEGRHLWAMVYLLHSYFGKDGRDEADELLQRHAGDVDNPRILNTFNEPIDDWLSFFMFTMFTDRDGKFQLLSLAESAFDPLSRSCKFMLTEEAHHLFVGQTGVDRVVRRAAELTKEHDTLDIAKYGGVPLPLIQKYINHWFSSCLDLFGSEDSTNAAQYYATGLKGRPHEDRFDDDHDGKDTLVDMEFYKDGGIESRAIPMRRAVNEMGRDGYIADNQKGVDMWNRTLAKLGVDFELKLPHKRFNRTVGTWAEAKFDDQGNLMSTDEWDRQRKDLLPDGDDKKFIKSLMQQVTEPGRMAGWIAPPKKGINATNFDEFEYVKL
jgi:benzoyl-CoA 2,3-dioxygenase component B